MEEYVAKATGSLSNTIRAKNNEYYGFYRGTVVNNEDPKDRGRCKIFVRGVYNDEFKDDGGSLLPWAEPCQPLFCGGMGQDGANGTFQCPDMNSTVWCFFENSDILKPVFFGQTTDANGKFSTKHCKMKWEKMYIDLFRGKNDRFTSSIIDSLSSSGGNSSVDENSYVMTLSANTDTILIAKEKDEYRYAGRSIHDTAKTEDYTRYAYRDITDEAETNDFTRIAGNDIFDLAVNSITLSASLSSIVITAPNSDIIINAANNVQVSAGTAVTLTAPSITLNGSSAITLNGPTSINGTCTVSDDVTAQKGITVSNDANIGGKSFNSHVHACPHGGTTGGPQ